MADIIEINIGTLAADIQEMKNELKALRNEMNLAFDSVTRLDAMWNGAANDAFNQAFQQDHQAMDDMCEIIDSLIAFMENARDEYRKCEEAVSAEIDSIRV